MKRFLLSFFLLVSTIIYANGNRSHHKERKPFSLATDYFRSVTNGNWGNTTTWESAPTAGGPWAAADLVPNFQADTIIIQSGDTVTISTPQDVDEVVIQNGGVLDFNLGTLTVEDGAGDDINIQSGGVFVLSLAATPPNFVSASATCNVATGATLRVSATGLTAQAPAAGVNAINFVYQHQSVLEYTSPLAFSTDNVTYFPNVNAVTIPIFRTTQNMGSVGANNSTHWNGIFEANGNITFINAGNKRFRNGIRGTGNIDGSTSGLFIIHGTTAELGGTGSLIVPVGLEIGINTVVTMISNKTITGNILLVAAGYVELGIYNLTVTGTVSGGAQNAYIKTTGTGVLTLNTVTSKTFPIGYTGYNPLVISNGGGVNYSARVENGINPAIAFPTYGINRTWNIQASAVNAGVTVAFQYATFDANAGAFPQPQAMEILQYSGSAWSIIPGNTGINPTGANPAWVVTTATGLAISTASSTPYALGKNGGWILPIDCIISTRAQKINNIGMISWTVSSCSEVRSFEVQRSVNNSGFQTIGTVDPVTNQTDFNFTDAALAGGRNLYRIKVNGIVGSSKYSNTVVLIHNSNDILISSLAPNPVHDKALLTVSTGRNTDIDFKIYNSVGNLVKQWSSVVAEGNNTIEVNAAGLTAGMYTVFAYSKGSTTVSRFVKQ